MAQMKQYSGQIVTIDGLMKRVYLGEQELRIAKRDELQGLFQPQPIARLQSAEAGLQFLRGWNRCVDLDNAIWGARSMPR
jgi:hypothetical protein